MRKAIALLTVVIIAACIVGCEEKREKKQIDTEALIRHYCGNFSEVQKKREACSLLSKTERDSDQACAIAAKVENEYRFVCYKDRGFPEKPAVK